MLSVLELRVRYAQIIIEGLGEADFEAYEQGD